MWNRRRGHLPKTIGGAFGALVVVRVGTAAVGGLLYALRLKPIGRSIMYMGACVAIAGLPFIAGAGAIYMDDDTRSP